MENFLLNTKLSEDLYYNTASKLPIIDYHNHLSVADIAENKRFESMYDLWLGSDPYKHRAMRICGIDEAYITGNASPYEKFEKWSGIVPKLIGNPLYHWTDMELKNVFGISTPLNRDTSKEIWDECNKKLKEDNFSASGLLRGFNVEYSAPCTSVADDISVFEGIKDTIVPSLRGDDITSPDKSFTDKLSSVTGADITDISSYIDALTKRIEEFDKIGCNFSDHAIDNGFFYCYNENIAEKAFSNVLKGQENSENDKLVLQSVLLMKLGVVYASFKWTLQLHIGALRFTSGRLRSIAGPAGGYAAISNTSDINSIVRLLNDIELAHGSLPKVIVFTLNPADNAAMSILSGSFSKSGTPAVVSQGPAWWWCDHIYGIKEVLENISTFGVLSTFAGMTTDSRSLLSFVRHDYFRRIVCGWMGEKVEKGEFPADIENLSSIVADICYFNAKNLTNRKEER